MKKLFLMLLALIATMGVNAQVMKILNGNEVVAKYSVTQANKVVFEESEDYQYVEIAGLKWAKKNVGAETEKDYGDYFAWGETEPRYTSYKRSGSDITFEAWKTAYVAGYSETKKPTFTGNKLDAAHDAATANWGSPWRTPTKAEFIAMFNATTWTWDETDKGYYVTNKDETLLADKSNALLFFPAAGFIGGLEDKTINTRGNYWSADKYDTERAYAMRYYITNSELNAQSYFEIYLGCSVRPVKN